MAEAAGEKTLRDVKIGQSAVVRKLTAEDTKPTMES